MDILNDGNWVSRYLQTQPLEHFTEHLQKLHKTYYTPRENLFNYHALRKSEDFKQLVLISRALATVDATQISSLVERLSFWLNLYNALSIHIVTQEAISSKVSAHKKFFNQFAYRIGDSTFTLDDIEHGILRCNRKAYGGLRYPFATDDERRKLILDGSDPRIHFAMYSACRSSCQWQVFTPETLKTQLKVATHSYLKAHSHFEPDRGRLVLPKLFHWYAGDFGTRHELVSFVMEHSDNPLLQNWSRHGHSDELNISYEEFDWEVNQTAKA